MFLPRIKADANGITAIKDVKWWGWDGGLANVWTVNFASDAGGDYVSEDPRFFIVLDVTGPCSIMMQTEDDRTVYEHRRPHSISYIPAGYPLHSVCRNISGLRHLDLHFDATKLLRRFAGNLDESRLEQPRLVFHDDKIAALSSLIAAECENEDPFHDLFGEELVSSLQATLFDIELPEKRLRSRLSEQQLQRVKAYIEAHCLETIRLSDLAQLAGLTESYFSHLFKVTTGVAPHRWQMQARIRKVQRLLLKKEASLTEVAGVSGFADQAHLTRVFKRHVGMPPAAWLRDYAL